MENTWKANTQEAKAGKLQTRSSLCCIETAIQKEKATKTLKLLSELKLCFSPVLFLFRFIHLYELVMYDI